MINQRMTDPTTLPQIRALAMLVLQLKARTEGSAIAASVLSFLSRKRMGHMRVLTHLMIRVVIMFLPYRDSPHTT